MDPSAWQQDFHELLRVLTDLIDDDARATSQARRYSAHAGTTAWKYIDDDMTALLDEAVATDVDPVTAIMRHYDVHRDAARKALRRFQKRRTLPTRPTGLRLVRPA